ncbi:MAG: thiamine phosphate synthase [Acidobacteria bacterium]|nr:thiamine phosphate synthase [Acidobacteriota bacterium]
MTDRRRFGGDDVAAREQVTATAAAAARAGVDLIHVRERDLADRALVDLVSSVVEAVAGTATAVVVNDRPDVALAAGAHGVHLRADSLPPHAVRRIAPPGFLIGRSVHSEDEARLVEQEGGADYLVFGTVFPSRSKPDRSPAGIDALRRACAAVRLPVLAIGGMTVERAVDVARAGASGIAAIGGDGADRRAAA